MNIFGSNHTVIGKLDENLILQTAGKIRIRYGNKFIDLLEEIETLKEKIRLLEG